MALSITQEQQNILKSFRENGDYKAPRYTQLFKQNEIFLLEKPLIL